MTFDEVLAQVTDLLQRQGRVSYGALKRRFALDDDYLQDVKGEIIDAQRLAVDEDGKVLVWVGEAKKGEKAKGAKGEKGKDSSEFGVRSSESIQPPTPSPQLPDARRQ